MKYFIATQGVVTGRILPVLFSFCLVISCGRSLTQDSKLNHDLGRVVNGAEKFRWVEISRSDFDQMNISGVPKADNKEFKAPALIESRLQRWIDVIDAAIRAQDPAGTGFIPKPMARVVNDFEANAFVAGVLLCGDLPMVYGAAADASVVDTLYQTAGSHSWTIEMPEDCIDRPIPTTEQLALVKYLWQDYPHCTVNAEEERIALAGDCGLPKPMKINRLGYYATANQITIQTGLISNLLYIET